MTDVINGANSDGVIPPAALTRSVDRAPFQAHWSQPEATRRRRTWSKPRKPMKSANERPADAVASLPDAPADPTRAARAHAFEADAVAMMELLFFAYRDFIGDPDAILGRYGFGRAHHRVLHFVSRNPGLRVADLLDILKITKQSLARVLKQLVDEGYIVQEAGRHDRRERHLYVTERGAGLTRQLAEMQEARLSAALAEAGPGAAAVVERFLFAMIDADQRPQVARLIQPVADIGRSTPVANPEETG